MDSEFQIQTDATGPVFQEGQGTLLDNLREGIERLASFAREEVLRRIGQAKPYPPVFTGTFLGSVAKSVDLTPGDQVRAAIGSPVEYGPVIEEGRRPGRFPPLAPLRVWARGRLGDEGLAFVVARKIAREGTRPRHVFRNAAAAVEERAETTIDDVLLEGFGE